MPSHPNQSGAVIVSKCNLSSFSLEQSYSRFVFLALLFLSTPHRCQSAKIIWCEHLASPMVNTDKLYIYFLHFLIIFLFLSLVQALDGNIYDHLKDYLMAFSRTELETCQAVQNTFQFLLETSSRVSLN